MKINDEKLSKVTGGTLTEADKDNITSWLQLRKDMGDDLDTVLEQVKADFNAKIDYYDLIDTEGKTVDLDSLLKYVSEYWQEV